MSQRALARSFSKRANSRRSWIVTSNFQMSSSRRPMRMMPAITPRMIASTFTGLVHPVANIRIHVHPVSNSMFTGLVHHAQITASNTKIKRVKVCTTLYQISSHSYRLTLAI